MEYSGEQSTMTAELTRQIKAIWDMDASTYDLSSAHAPQRPHEVAAWRATLRRLLPVPPAKVLDVGAGTGFISLNLAAMGYRVTSIDLSTKMLAVLESKAKALGLDIKTIHTDASDPPLGESFDVVVERHVVWTLPHPAETLASWRESAPDGRLVLIEGSWGATRGVTAVQARIRELRRLITGPKLHEHDNYPDNLVRALPFAKGILPAEAVQLVEDSPWGIARFERLTDIEYCSLSERGILTEILGTTQRWAVIAGS